jgi:sec-independent protein translocase protein TatC
MTLTEHLEDLRWCLLKSVIAVFVISSVCYYFSDVIFGFMVAPLRQNLQPGQSLIGTSVTEAFFSELKGRFGGWRAVLQPVYFLPDLAFYRAGAFGREKKVSGALCLVRDVVFLSAARTFCYRIVLPVAFKYFIEQYATMGVTPAIRIGEYFTFFSVWFWHLA